MANTLALLKNLFKDMVPMLRLTNTALLMKQPKKERLTGIVLKTLILTALLNNMSLSKLNFSL